MSEKNVFKCHSYFIFCLFFIASMYIRIRLNNQSKLLDHHFKFLFQACAFLVFTSMKEICRKLPRSMHCKLNAILENMAKNYVELMCPAFIL